VTDEAWPSRTEREIRSVQLEEISIVHARPAYDATSVTARHRQSVGRHDTFARLRLLSVL
jgi:phage head maturation protease